MNYLVSIIILIALFFFVMKTLWKKIMPSGVASYLIAGVLHDGIKGIWHLIFGPQKVQVVNRRRRQRKQKR